MKIYVKCGIPSRHLQDSVNFHKPNAPITDQSSSFNYAVRHMMPQNNSDWSIVHASITQNLIVPREETH